MRETLAYIDRYRVERELGAGAMGRVYLAHDVKHGRPVALKTLHPEIAASVGAERFLREIRIAAQLNHPHILPLHDSGDAGGTLFYVMPFASGETLRHRLERDRRLPVADALRIVGEVADAMDHAHRNGVVHRDLKPENILIHEGHAVVADFGIARALEAMGAASMTQAGISLGTPAYMSPEQAAGDPSVDGRSDIYSLGCVLYEALAGEPPFTGPSAAAIIAKRFTQDPPPLRERRGEVSEQLANTVARALAREPGDRFATARELGDALQLALAVISSPGAAGVAATVSDKSIVVLPFANLSSDPENEYFSDGLTEELIADLSRVRALRVISRTSAMQYKGTDKDARRIGRELGVTYVLEGSVRKAGSSVRITAQLIDAATDSHLWAEKYTGTLDDIFALQERVSNDIVRGLDLTLSPGEAKALAERPIADATAYDYYLRARHQLGLFSPGALDRLEMLVSRGMEIVGDDNAHLRAMLGLADVFRIRLGHSFDPALIDSAETHARSALASDPDSAPGHHLLALVEFERGHMAEAVEHLQQTLRSDPGHIDALFLLGIVYLYPGCTAEARAVAERLTSLDPLTAHGSLIESVSYWFEGRFAEGVEPMARALRLTSESTLSRWQYAYALALNGRIDETAHEAEQLARTDPDNPYTLQLASMVKALRGDAAGAIETAAALDMAKLDHHTSFHVGECYTLAGEAERAMAWFDSAVDKGFYPYDFIARHNPFLANVRGTAAFDRFVAKVRAKRDAFVARAL